MLGVLSNSWQVWQSVGLLLRTPGQESVQCQGKIGHGVVELAGAVPPGAGIAYGIGSSHVNTYQCECQAEHGPHDTADWLGELVIWHIAQPADGPGQAAA